MALLVSRRSFMSSGIWFCRSFSLSSGNNGVFAPPPIVSSRRVVVTGLGMVTPLGAGVKTTWNNLLEGKSGIRAITLEDLKMNAFNRETQLNTFDQLKSKVAAIVPTGTKPGEFNEEIWLNSKY